MYITLLCNLQKKSTKLNSKHILLKFESSYVEKYETTGSFITYI